MYTNYIWNLYERHDIQRDREYRREQYRLVQTALAHRRQQRTVRTDGILAKGHRWLTTWWRAYRQRQLRRSIIRTATRLGQLYPAWEARLFDRHFLLHRGLPILERHVAAPAATDAFDLALAWVEQFPAMPTETRKRHLQALTPVAAEFLRRLRLTVIQSHSITAGANDSRQHRIGTPLAYGQSSR